jgi:hypothetical protein
MPIVELDFVAISMGGGVQVFNSIYFNTPFSSCFVKTERFYTNIYCFSLDHTRAIYQRKLLEVLTHQKIEGKFKKTIPVI